MFKIQLTNLRCFYEQSPLEIRPITFLVGENSAGKTTFMAAARILLESVIRVPQNPFNRDPYFLGGFDQIAHYRGGVKGRAKSFWMDVTIPTGSTYTDGRQVRPTSEPTRHKLTFVKGAGPQPSLSEYDFVTQSATVRLGLTGKLTLKLLRPSGEEWYSYEPRRLPPAELLRKDLSYLRFLFDEIAFITAQPPENQSAHIDREILTAIQQLVSRYRESSRFLARRIFASAPVRTQPLRTYTPSEIESSSEGAHVPLEMARQKISAPSEWETVHERLKTFGKRSGLFEDVDIRLLGKRDGDPFQVVVKTKGQPFNLVDVGYGVSQALPLIYQLEQRQHDSFFLQQPEVHLHPRAQAELGSVVARLSKQRASSLFMLETHSDYIIDRIRMEVAAGRLDHNSVTIIFFDRKEHEVEATNIYLNEGGEIMNAPDNYRTFFLEEQSRLLGI
jgi:putative AbiEii toxin of type IV toxin-antitoxin system